MEAPTVQTGYRKPSGIVINQSGESRLGSVDLNNSEFGSVFSDHMAVIRFNGTEWGTPEIAPFDSFRCSPSLIALHYGQTVFEGMKAFRGVDGSVRIFRPDKHIERLNNSCRRLCIPELDTDYFLEALKTLIQTDHAWTPTKRGNSLYIRPLVFGTDECLGVRPSRTYSCIIIASPVGNYYKEGLNPVSLTTNPEFVRAARGGAGFAKTSGNYGSTLLPAQKAKEQGFTQILWLDAKEHTYVEEVGTMNIFFKFRDALVTPPADGTILPGVIRDSVIQVAGQWGIPVEQRKVSINELFESGADGTLEEIFGTGTAAVISPVGKIVHDGRTLITDMEKTGEFTQKMYSAITSIQYGESDDLYSWMVPVQ